MNPPAEYPKSEDAPFCAASPQLRLPSGAVLNITGGGGRQDNFRMTFAALPADVNEATFELPCLADTAPHAAPENWQLPLRFVPAPPEMNLTPVLDVPTATPASASPVAPTTAPLFGTLQNWNLLVGFAFIILGVILLVLSQNVGPDQRTIVGFAVAALILGGLAVLGWHILRYLNQEYVLTNRRVLQVAGVLNKTSTDSSLEKINDARLSQSVFGRIFGFGDLDILTAAETGVERFRMIRNPVGFKKAMLDAKHEYERDVAGPEPGRRPARPDARRIRRSARTR